jgi:glycosyltransferase involved in cell wall biosynthesis
MKDKVKDTMTSGNSTTKRVLVIGPLPPPYGGIATVIESIVNSELRRDYSFEMFNRSESLYDPGTSSFHRKIIKVRRAWNLFNSLWSGGYDFIHLHGSTSGFLGDTLVMIVAFVTGSKVLLHLHGTDWERFYGSVSLFRRFYVRIGLAIPKRIVVLYDLWAQNIRKIDPRINVRVIRNFVPDCPSPGQERLALLRKDLAIRDDEFVISSIGRVGWRKGSFDIVEAAKQVVGECKDCKILLVGGEENVGEMNQLKEAVDKNKLDQWVKLIGEVDIEDVPLFLGISDVFVLPSYYEGMPMSIIEAMRSGKAIISTKVGAIPDMIESRVSGILINPGSPDEIADSILTLKGDIPLREKLSSQARKAFESGFETSRVLLSLRELYQEMASN